MEKVDKIDKHRFATQPKYKECTEKIKARQALIEKYREITGNHTLPDQKQYWTLCHEQDNSEGSEIVQLQKMGFLTKSQFYGIDDNFKLIENNRIFHPEANFFHGDWLEEIYKQHESGNFNPGLIYFDYTRTLVSKLAPIYVGRTLNICPVGTIVAANLMVTNGHNKDVYDSETFSRKLWENVWAKDYQDSDYWVVEEFAGKRALAYQYKGSKTVMRTYFFKRIKAA